MAPEPADRVAAVCFDLDGVLLDSERVWDAERRALAAAHGAHWPDGATEAMQGMSAPEWSAYMHDELGLALTRAEISSAVAGRLLARYAEHLPLIDGAREAVAALAARWPLALASSANRPVIDRALELGGLTPSFVATVSSEEVPRGKPAPDVYLEAARRLGVAPTRCVAVEDSPNGVRAAAAAGMAVIAIPDPAAPFPADARALAAVVLGSVADLRPATVQAAA